MRSRDHLGTLTDCFVQSRDTTFVDRGSYQIARTPTRPDFYCGNSLILDHPPLADDDAAAAPHHQPRTVSAWLQRCRQDLADIPLRTARLAWETGPRASPDSAGDWPGAHQLPAGVLHTCTPVLAIESPVAASAPPPGYILRPLASDSDWDAFNMLAVTVSAGDVPEHRSFVRWQVGELRRTTAVVGGCFWGAFYQHELAACLGLLRTSVGLRFQEVQTHPDHRRRGLCMALCTHALSRQLQADTVHTSRAIIVTEIGSDAARVYRRIGFADIGLQHTLLQPLTTP